MSVDCLGPDHWWVGAASMLPEQVLTVPAQLGGTAGPARVRPLVPDTGWAQAEAAGADLTHASFRHD